MILPRHGTYTPYINTETIVLKLSFTISYIYRLWLPPFRMSNCIIRKRSESKKKENNIELTSHNPYKKYAISKSVNIAIYTRNIRARKRISLDNIWINGVCAVCVFMLTNWVRFVINVYNIFRLMSSLMRLDKSNNRFAINLSIIF